MAARLFKAHRQTRVPNNIPSPYQAKQEYKAVCKRKFKEFKRAVVQRTRKEIGESMRVWLQSEEAMSIRQRLAIPEILIPPISWREAREAQSANAEKPHAIPTAEKSTKSSS